VSYPGGKGGAGVWQRLVNEMPPHDVYVAPFLGNCAVLRNKLPAAINVGIDTDPDVIRMWQHRSVEGLQLFLCDGMEWLRHWFGLYRVQPANVARRISSRVLVYADPPYRKESRRDSTRDYYPEDDWTDQDHRRLIETLRTIDADVMVSHYVDPLYGDLLADWRSFRFQAMTRGGVMADEQVWMNYRPPERLHDPRWLGGEKREREKLTRRRRNLLGKLRRLPVLERQALLQAMKEL
jgi:DNA adenine methylase